MENITIFLPSAWQPPADDGGQLLSGYRLFRDDGSTGVPNIIIWNGENAANKPLLSSGWLRHTDGRRVFHILEFSVTGLNPGSTYTFAVAALNTAGEGAKSATLTVQAGEGPSFTTPPRRDLSRATDSVTVNIQWNVPENLNNLDVLGRRYIAATATFYLSILHPYGCIYPPP